MSYALIGLAVVLVLRFLLAPITGEAQLAGQAVHRIGFLSGGRTETLLVEGLRQGLREHGYVESQNVRIERRFAEGRNDRLPSLTEELVRLKVEVVVTATTGVLAIAARRPQFQLFSRWSQTRSPWESSRA